MSSVTNTLFRFITMRAPELVSPEAKALLFIEHPLSDGHFLDLLSIQPDAEERKSLQASLVSSFSPTPTVEYLRGNLGTFSEFSRLLATKREEIGKDETYLSNHPELLEYENINPEDAINLWDDLFYQLLTNQSPALRDELLQALVAWHFLSNASLPNVYQTALAKVVIPRNFYGFADGITENSLALPPLNIKPLNKVHDVFLSKLKNERLSRAVDEIRLFKKEYDLSNLNTYKDSRTAYETAVDEIIASNTTIDPETGAAMVTPYVLPRFQDFYTPALEMDEEDLSSQFSSETLHITNSLGLFETRSFDDSISRLQDERRRLEETVIGAMEMESKAIAIDNVILPVHRDPITPDDLYGFIIEPVVVTAGVYNILLTLNAGYENADVTQADYTADLGENESSSDFFDSAIANRVNLILFPGGLTTSETSFGFNGEIILSNGITLGFDTTVTVGQRTSGRMVRVVENEEGGGNNDPLAGTGNFLPSRFGLKRLGIADYRKVEQTVCCYVPGEVSHIENVMNKEYKERSTRRLRRSEDTLTTESQSERERLSDTTSTDRYEMQQQASNVINTDIQLSAGVNTHYDPKGVPVTIDLSANIAHNTSKQQSNTQALNYAKDVTTRALDRVVEKVREERIIKVIEEFEEQNKHGFDNRQGTDHVCGVYRWIDKIYKNQVCNYGKRLMYEFMVPQPSAFHQAAMKALPDSASITLLSKPADPRTEVRDYMKLNENNAAAWAAVYNAEIEQAPALKLVFNQSFSFTGQDNGGGQNGGKNDNITIPEGYRALSAQVAYEYFFVPNVCEYNNLTILIGGERITREGLLSNYRGNEDLRFKNPIENALGVSMQAGDFSVVTYNVVVRCERTEEHYRKWQLKTFNAIVSAYEDRLSEYKNALEEMKAVEKGTNPNFFRQIENIVLRKNCIGYLVSENNRGRYEPMYTGSNITDLKPKMDNNLDAYASLVKFIEQAFEWDEISYTFYPFYWNEKKNWQAAYQQQVEDPLFRSFLQSGMARVIVTVRPGFEEAVMHYMGTGQIWNGGQVPVIGDDLYLSVVEELKNPEYAVEETWETRVPTSLTVIQSGSIGLNLEGLPCDCGDTDTGIESSDATMGVVIPA